MDNGPNQNADELVTLTPDLIEKLKRTIGFLRGGADALIALQRRTYITAEQGAQICAEVAELEREDIEPLRAALRDGALTASQRQTVERLGRRDM